MMTFSVSEVTILPNAAPMITPTARSSTLPRAMNVLNSCNMPMSFPVVLTALLPVACHPPPGATSGKRAAGFSRMVQVAATRSCP
jgi:hypothetical protein